MVTGMLKLTMRQIRSSLTRFLAIAAIVALGVGFFCGLRLTKTAMVHTLNDYAEAHRMYDFRLVSTVGFDETDAEMFRIRELVKKVFLTSSQTRPVSLGSRLKGAAARCSARRAHPSHVCEPSGIFSDVHAAGENDST